MALLLPGGIALLAGLDAALLLLGLPAPLTTDRLPQVHGGLLVLGFVGTVIALERSVALRRPWGHLAPGGLGLGALLVLSPAPLALGQGVLVAGTLALLGVYAALWQRQASAWLALQVLGAVLAAGSALLWWSGAPVATALPWFAGFLVLTIAGERLELARVGMLGDGVERGVLLLGVGLFAAVVATTLWPPVAHPVLGAALLGLVGTLLVHDVARRTIRSTGLPRYMAWCLLAGYGWLLVAGGTWLLLGSVTAGPAYDAVVHAVFLGFTLSMIMAHAPVILPAVLTRPLPYRPVLYVPVALLHASLLLRIAVGDLHGQAWALQVGGALNIAAVLLFLLLAVWSSVRGVPAAANRKAARTERTEGTDGTESAAPHHEPEVVR
ncbi:hypothetical protein [Actinotalea sp. K2]|uniref:hypothetical protein n=1 Tax=Actinotalea sp. K2 TaxID=2939438 RepID=UPI002017FE80|nr:hypothetical protein [Actinotalea sp. K2]MCL3862784.1 hypothetical protein [Actinotalea sp. K2]